jgi:hypothetical protein
MNFQAMEEKARHFSLKKFIVKIAQHSPIFDDSRPKLPNQPKIFN